ncbi:TRAP transporter substrate-binding protein DctP [Nitratireductor sp. ZSWI3]|uniref:TRAP transporter substrate-binding protein DctP n=1 Tax=Nitratireductor sp. ZSWI3 TaxID=2966359 RepID=UPI00214FAA6B|nr:TRAP transporter substrate-binding protein DctP [Nitratireductor sp. ZSWI3]MCR4265149.1 TRAP transporter substrate-binding protein DctP [Nitratireductor sp. ZSWI3]
MEETAMTQNNRKVATLLAVTALLLTGAAHAETLRLSTLKQPGSDGAQAAEKFATLVGERTEGRVEVKVYPASQLGDWTEVYEQVMQGAIDMAMQPLATADDKRLAITWFPYAFTNYETAKQSLSPGGAVFDIVSEAIADKGLTPLGVYGEGMGGAGFAGAVANPSDTELKRNLKIRVWPGGVTHRVLLERFGFNTATLPWAELYTGMQTGVVDGQIGGTAGMALESFKDITKTWVQYNDHFEGDWFIVNSERYASLSEADQKILLDAAQEVSSERFEQVEAADAKHLDTMRQAGIEVVTFDDATLDKLAGVARTDVWPQIAGELGEETLSQLKSSLGIN